MKSNREPLARIGGRLLRDKFAILRNLHCFEFSVHKRIGDIEPYELTLPDENEEEDYVYANSS